ncbi:hypothetical protein ACFPRL_22790 [Pseudoclavibacter helvolus]
MNWVGREAGRSWARAARSWARAARFVRVPWSDPPQVDRQRRGSRSSNDGHVAPV